MAQLIDPLLEAFAQARAGGATWIKAYAQAGFEERPRHAYRLAGRRDVSERIDEIKRGRDPSERACLRDAITDLMAVADASVALKCAGGMKEARLARLEAYRLWGILQDQN